MNNKKTDNSSEFLSWVIIFICFLAVWPLGLFLLLAKLGVIGKARNYAKNYARPTNAVLENRFQAYMRIVEGQASVSMDKIASAAGVSYETALREVQQMLTLGKFGPEAYINYMTKALILRSSAGVSAGPDKKSAAPAVDKKTEEASDAEFRPALPSAKKYRMALRVLLLIFGLIFAFAGAVAMLSSAAIIAGMVSGTAGLLEIFFSAFIFTGGCSALFVRSHIKKRVRRFAIYMPILSGRKSVSIAVLAETAGVSESVTRHDLEIMVENGYLGPSAYINVGAGLLVLTPDAYTEDRAEPPHMDEPSDDSYSSILREIRQLNDAIPDPAVSERIYRIEEITSKIFGIVQEKPEKLPQIKSFMSYYLPTTLKLLRSYSVFERQGITGDNIEDAKKNIERILDSLVSGFTKQFDQLFISDAMDISTDINVLESMLKKDGFTGDGADFQVAGGH